LKLKTAEPPNRRRLTCSTTLTTLNGLTLVLTQAPDRQSLQGFQQYRFGMSEQKIRTTTQINDSSSEEGNVRLKAADTTQVDGAAYQLSFLLKDGKLYRVNLLRESSARVPNCDGLFERIFGLVRAKYGAPDKEPEVTNVSGISQLSSARFTFRDGGIINTSTLYLKQKCTVSVAYTAGMKGGLF